MIHVDAPVIPERKAMFLPLKVLGQAKQFNDRSLNVKDFEKYKLVHVEGVNDFVALPWDMDSLRRLALHDIMVPGPIRWDYHWPSKYPRPLNHQVVTADFLTQNPRAFVLNAIGCVSGDTEYLTPTGWRRIDEYDGGVVAQYWPDTGKADFVQPLEYVDMPCDEMYRFNARGADQLLSKEHRVLYRTARGKLKTELAEKVANDHWDAKWWHYGQLITDFTMESEGVDLTDDELRLWVAVCADATIFKCTTKDDRVAMYLDKERKKERLRSLLSRMGIKWSETQGQRAATTRFAFDWGLASKTFDPLWSASVAQRRVIVDECVYWDGSRRKDRGHKFSTARAEHADFIQWCAVSTGKQATRLSWSRDSTTYYDVYFKMRTSYPLICGQKKSQVTRVAAPRGRKYCFMTPSKYLVLRRNGKVFMTGNTSKTLSSLWAADYLMRRGEIRKVLISSTLSTLERTWELEILSNLMGRTCTILDGSRKRRLKRLNEDHDFYIINHDGLKVMEQELVDADFDLVIVDEGAVFRNQKTGLWRSCFNVAGIHTNRWLWWMTGAPMPNEPTDIWGQAKIVRPDTVPRYFGRFRNQVMFKLSQFKWVPVKGYEQIVYNTVRPVIRYERDVCDLPPDHTIEVECEMSKDQQAAYKTMADSLVLEVQQQVVTALNEGVKLNKLLQIACGAVYDVDKNVIPLNPEPKFQELDQLFEFSERKLIVYAPFKYCLPMIRDRYKAQGVRVEMISGDTPKAERVRLFRDFQDGDLEMLVAHPQCMAHGLTLHRSNVIAWWAPIDNYEIYEQACGRIKRPGQVREQFVAHLASSKVEKAVYKRNRNKEKTQGVILDLFKKGA